MAAVRNEKGQFVKGHPDVGAGRKPRETEQYFVDLFRNSVSDADFRDVIEALVKAAKRGNTAAMKLLFDYLMGPPVQRTEITGAEGGAVKHETIVEIKGVDYRTVAAKLAPGSVQDSDTSS